MAIALIAAAATCCGCVPVMSWLFVSTPNQGIPTAGRLNVGLPDLVSGVDQRFWVDVPWPPARLSVAVIDPPDGQPPRGTILTLHGFRNRAFWMSATAKAIAEAGYRSVLVDLRGHGRSSGSWLSYGVHESSDLVHVIDELAGRGMIEGPLGVFGVSLGGSTAIQLAARDSRISAVVAAAPFASMREEVPHYFRTVLPFPGRWMSDELFQSAIDQAGTLAGFDPDDADTIAAARRTRAAVLILHGTDDWLVPPQHGLAIHRAAPFHSQLVLLPELGHVTIWSDPSGDVRRLSVEWFDRQLGGTYAALP